MIASGELIAFHDGLKARPAGQIWEAVEANHRNNDALWKEEDLARRRNVPDAEIAANKRANELMAHSYGELYGMRSTGLRFFTVYGPWGRPDMALFIFTRAILEGKPIRVFNGGDMLRDFTYIDDIVEAVTALLERPQLAQQDAPKARLFNIGHGSPVKLMDYVQAIEQALGRKASIELAPMQQGDVQATYASTEKLRAAIGYAPSTTIETGVGRFIEWYRSYYAGTGGLAA